MVHGQAECWQDWSRGDIIIISHAEGPSWTCIIPSIYIYMTAFRNGARSVEIYIQPKLRNINLHNITHSLISWNPRERMWIVHISLLIVIDANHQRSRPTPLHCAMCQYVECHLLLLLLLLMMPLVECWCMHMPAFRNGARSVEIYIHPKLRNINPP